MPEDPDLFAARHEPYIRVRVERRLFFVARQTFDEYKALGGNPREDYLIDPDLPLAKAHELVIKDWSANDGILSYLAQWGFMDHEVIWKQNIKVYINGELIHEEEQ